MKKNAINVLFASGIIVSLFTGCKKEILPEEQTATVTTESTEERGQLKQTKYYSNEVVVKWMELQLRILRSSPTPVGGLMPGRYFGYCGIAAYESVVPGMHGFQSLYGQLTGMPAMPAALKHASYHWAASANAALAAMNRSFFPATTTENLAAIDSLENALYNAFAEHTNATTLQRSADFGKAVAQLVFDWSKTDGTFDVNPVYVPPTGPGMWVPTPPAFAPATAPYWGNHRLLVAGSLNYSTPPAPPPYSADVHSKYYHMVKEVYDVSQHLTAADSALGLYYRDFPGYGGGHYCSILMQVLQQDKTMLDKTAMAYAKAGIACIEAGIGCWKVKYHYNVERPITYIANELNHPEWLPLFATPAFPEYTSGHSTVGGAFTAVMANLFGEHYHFTNHTYDYLGMAPRSFNSFKELANDISTSRVLAGIHYRISCVRGQATGERIGENINHKLQFYHSDRDDGCHEHHEAGS